jgi:HEAT repeat protein
VETVRPLVERLSSEDAAARSAAERDLLAMGPDAIKPLLWIVTEGRRPQVAAIRALLPKYGPPAIGVLAAESDREFIDGLGLTRETAVDAVAQMGEPAFPVIQDALEDPRSALFEFGTRVVVALQEKGQKATALLLPLVDVPDADVRRNAVKLLARSPDRQASGALVKAMRDADPLTRMYAATGLGAIGDPAVIESLTEALDDPLAGTREAAIVGLWRMDAPRFGRKFGMIARSDPDVSVRNAAASSLLVSKDPIARRLGRRYEPILVDPARDRSISMRRYTLILLTSFGLISFMTVTGTFLASRRSGRDRTRTAIGWSCALRAVGFFCGGILPHVTKLLELVMLLNVAPPAIGTAYAAAFVMGLDARKLVGLASAAAFYLGYGLGWMWLWGYLGL